ncbi:MAG: hypothetical protein SNJ71_03570 [Bacteroidales bacterium]
MITRNLILYIIVVGIFKKHINYLRIEVENFSGKTAKAVKQDFYAKYF